MHHLVLAVLLIFSISGSAFAEMSVHFIDVGQGGAVFIEKDGRNIVYDCGDTFASQVVVDYLEAHDVETIDALIVSHAHKDHMGGCLGLFKKFKVAKVYHNDSKAQTGTWKAFLKTAAAASNIVVIGGNTETAEFDILVAYDHRDRFSKEADNSLLLRLTDGQVRVLLTGDCEAVCERALMRSNSRIKVSVLNVGHHGSNASSTLLFLQKVAPEIAVISAGANNQYGHPTAPVLQRLKQLNADVRRTDLDGSIVIHSDGHRVKIETEK